MWVWNHSSGLNCVGWLLWRGKSFLSNSLLMVEKSCTIWRSSDTGVYTVHLLGIIRRWHGLHWIGVCCTSYSVTVHDCTVSALPESLLKATPCSSRSMLSLGYRHSLRVNWLFYKASFIIWLLGTTSVWLPTRINYMVRWVVWVKLLNSNLRRRKPLSISSWNVLCRVSDGH
jgi:hypothetical protein